MMLTAFALAAASLAASPSAALPQEREVCEAITTVNVIEVQPGKTREARAYYRTGWASAREVALERGVIASYNLLVSESGVSEEPEVILITTYQNRAQFDQAEERFQAIFEELDLPRPLLIEGLTRAQILGPIEGAEDYRTVYSSLGNCAVPGHPIGG